MGWREWFFLTIQTKQIDQGGLQKWSLLTIKTKKTNKGMAQMVLIDYIDKIDKQREWFKCYFLTIQTKQTNRGDGSNGTY